MTPTSVPFGYQVSREGDDDNPAPRRDYATTASSGSKIGNAKASFEERLAAALSRNKGPIDWATVMVRKDSGQISDFNDAPHGVTNPDGEHWPSIPEPQKTKFRDLYLTHFHHRWPLIHVPTFEMNMPPPVLQSCVAMIGAYIHGTSESKELAMGLHTSVIEYLFPRLVCLPPSIFGDHPTNVGTSVNFHRKTLSIIH